MSIPRVSVIMPVYNGGRFLASALDSVLAQTFRDFELIALDDGSTDGSGDVLDNYASLDSRMRVIHQANQGLVSALNLGLELAIGEYIARMDADDLCSPIRFEKQVACLDAHPAISVLGTQTHTIHSDGHSLGISQYPLTPFLLRWTMLLHSAIAHPTIMARRERLLHYGGYEAEYAHAEDYALWTRMAITDDLANLPDVLFTYRWSNNNISTRYRSVQLMKSASIVQRYTRALLSVDVSLEQAKSVSDPVVATRLADLKLEDIEAAFDQVLWLYEIFAAHFKPGREDAMMLRAAVGDYLYPLAAVAVTRDPVAGLRMSRSIFSVSKNPRSIFQRGAGKLRHFLAR